jgi:hypothetical protein
MMANGIYSATKRNTSQLLRSSSNVPCLKRHEINENYYAIKKIRSKIEAHALRSESGMPSRIESSSSENRARGWFGRGRRAFTPAGLLLDNRQPIWQFFLRPTGRTRGI